MAMDVQIDRIEARVTVADPALLKDPRFLAQIVAMVKEELKREALEEDRRARDRQASHAGGGR